MNNFYKTILTFNDIEINLHNTLIICDIDDTILYYEKNLDHFIDIVKKDFSHFNQKEILQEAISYYNFYRNFNKPLHTDFNGFSNLLYKIKNFNSKLIFLTARTSNSIITTSNDFKSIGINYNDFNIYYTNNKISKGDYIKNFIDINKYNQIIFIDDNNEYINSVHDLFPNIICYLFRNDKKNI
jgi:hypothetical protein